ncbi:glucoamylase family protein [Algoriphagus sp. D3-2-R+10]|uniref:glucoamylase family protein n=1 Tax=Algoriphagus aurantiacus TaxID=3103948 RepID=UPI002B39C86E|nr:glucoamylase family protein [Algoriphagus sp. D3-2-R+10]MEB2775088.1 glucoamylase family protein [Algoriphagus sp. D3-2-R+10]
MKTQSIFSLICPAVLTLACSKSEEQVNTIKATPYDIHVELAWEKAPEVDSYEVWVSMDDENYTRRAVLEDTIYLDFVNDLGTELELDYEIRAHSGDDSTIVGRATTKTHKMTDEELLDMVEFYTFRYFWDGAEPNSGMGPERIHLDGEYPQNDAHVVTTGGSGMGIIGLIAGMERGWITKEQGVARFEKIVGFLEKADRFKGVWPHWINGQTGKVQPFGQKDNGGDLVESAFLMQSLIAVREYFKEGDDRQKAVASRIDQLWKEMDWSWYTQDGQDVLYWHWSPEYAWEMNFPLEGYNECLITYVLAASSPTHTVDPDVYHKGWARSGGIKAKNEAFGYELQLKHNGAEKMGGPLFWAHYSYLGLNPMGLKDQYADYQKENTNHTLINRAWAIENSGGFAGYGEDLWGLTASYSINGYNAHFPGNDTGVISPTAAISSIPYTPEESMKVIKNLYYNYGKKVLGRYGFYDAMSPEHDFYPNRYLAIDQGPMVTMIENYRTGLGWKLFMGAPEIQEGLKKLGFESPSISN